MRKMKNKFTFSWKQRESYNISHTVDFWEHSRMYIVIYCYFLYPIPPTLPHGSTILIRGWEGPRKVNDPDQTFGVGGLCAPEAGPGLCPPPPRVYRYTTGNPLYWARIAGKIKPEHRMDWTKARSMLGLTSEHCTSVGLKYCFYWISFQETWSFVLDSDLCPRTNRSRRDRSIKTGNNRKSCLPSWLPNTGGKKTKVNYWST